MTYINFLKNGINGNQAVYRRDNYPNDKVTPIGTSNSFIGVISSDIDNNNTKKIIIDNAIQISTVSDIDRNNCIEVWNKLKNGTKITFRATLIGSLAGITLSLALGILSTLVLVSMVVGVVSLGVLGFACFLSYRCKQANNELDLWSDSIGDHLNRRKMISTNGLIGILENSLLENYVSENELQNLWLDHLKDFQNKAIMLASTGSVNKKTEFVRDFCDKGPFSDATVKLVFKEKKLPDKYSSIPYECSRLQHEIGNIEISSSERNIKIYEESVKEIKEIQRHNSSYKSESAYENLGNALESLSAISGHDNKIENKLDVIRKDQDKKIADELFPKLFRMLEDLNSIKTKKPIQKMDVRKQEQEIKESKQVVEDDKFNQKITRINDQFNEQFNARKKEASAIQIKGFKSRKKFLSMMLKKNQEKLKSAQESKNENLIRETEVKIKEFEAELKIIKKKSKELANSQAE